MVVSHVSLVLLVAATGPFGEPFFEFVYYVRYLFVLCTDHAGAEPRCAISKINRPASLSDVLGQR